MINTIIKDIKKSIDNECFFAALALALMLPDICGKAENRESKEVGKRYINWYNKNVLPMFTCGDVDVAKEDAPYQSGEMIYGLRNSLLHSGNPSIDVEKIQEERNKVIRFALYVSEGPVHHTTQHKYQRYGDIFGIEDRMIAINVLSLSKMLCEASTKYYEENKEKFDFINYEIYDIRGTDISPAELLDSTDIQAFELNTGIKYTR